MGKYWAALRACKLTLNGDNVNLTGAVWFQAFGAQAARTKYGHPSADGSQ